MRNISSVHIFEIVKSKVKAILLILIGLAVLFSKDIFYVGIILIPLGGWWFISIKNECAVRISTNACEANSVVINDKIYIQKIVSAVIQAFVHRG